jgi:AcrR family transcriptional regulator
VDAAAELVREHGFDGLSMRALAERCGVGVMTLYGYVRTREELLRALADRIYDAVELPEPSDLVWSERIAVVLRSVRLRFLEHPELVPLVASQRMDGVAAYRGAELVLGALREAGLPDRDVVSVFNALSSYTFGSVLREVGLATRHASAVATVGELPLDAFPHVIELTGLLMVRDPEHDFEVGLEMLLSGVAHRGLNEGDGDGPA